MVDTDVKCSILGFGNIADAVEILAIGYILTVYEEEEGKMTPWESSFLTAAVFAGMLLGGFAGGICGDILGRKPVLCFTLALNGISAFLSAFSTNIYWLIFFRTLAGIGVGGVVSSLFALCLEHVPTSSRGKYVTILCSFWMFGSILTAGTAWIMLGKNPSTDERILNISWRYFAAIVGLPSILCFFFTWKYIPESAPFLASRGQIQQVTQVLQTIQKVNEDPSHSIRTLRPRPIRLEFSEEYLTKHLPINKGHQSPWQEIWSQVCHDPTRIREMGRLCRNPYLGSTLLLMSCGFCLSFGSYGLSSWITKLFQAVSLENPFANAFMFAGANLPGNLVSLYLVDLIGRHHLLSGSFGASALCSLLFAFNVNGSKGMVVFVSCLFNACTTCAWNSFGVLSSESFPLEVRTTGIALVNCSNRIGAITSQFVNGFLVGPPPHLVALLVTVSSVMTLGGILARQIPSSTSGIGVTGSGILHHQDSGEEQEETKDEESEEKTQQKTRHLQDSLDRGHHERLHTSSPSSNRNVSGSNSSSPKLMIGGSSGPSTRRSSMTTTSV
jgi:MFS family permease